MDSQLWREGREYIQRKRLSLAVISTSQIIFGTICTLLWVASFEVCQRCAEEDEWETYCAWVSPMQGIWGGCFIFICGLVGILHSCAPTRYLNSELVFLTIVTMLACLGMTAIEALIVTGEIFETPGQNFISMCVGDSYTLWNYFHYTIIFVGLLATLQALSCCIMVSYAQCGCCGIYCRETRHTNTEIEQVLPNPSHERLILPYGVAAGQQPHIPPSYNIALDPNYAMPARARASATVLQRDEQPTTVDDLIQLDATQECPLGWQPIHDGVTNQVTHENEQHEHSQQASASQITEAPPPYSA